MTQRSADYLAGWRDAIQAACGPTCRYCMAGIEARPERDGDWVHHLPTDVAINPRGFAWDYCKAGPLRELLGMPSERVP